LGFARLMRFGVQELAQDAGNPLNGDYGAGD
jgi:hypothetical protein